MPDTKKEICSIRIMFPTESDEQALDCKRKIKEVLAEIADVQIQFSLMDAPTRPPVGA